MIDIKMYGVPKGEEGVATVSQVILSQNANDGGTPFEPHYIWGQLFRGTEDVDGDMKVNGYAYKIGRAHV